MARGDLRNPDPLQPKRTRTNTEILLFWAAVALAVCVLGTLIRALASR